MRIERFLQTHWFALMLVGLHALLIGAWAWIELDNAWNDRNPTMLVMAALHLLDYPVHALLKPWIDSVERTGTFLAALFVLGSLYWFIIGSLIALAFRKVVRFPLWRRWAH